MNFAPHQYIEAMQHVSYMGVTAFVDINILKERVEAPTVTKFCLFKYPNGKDIECIDITNIKFDGKSYHHIGQNFYTETLPIQRTYINFEDIPINYN
jgi:hypothetical protein